MKQFIVFIICTFACVFNIHGETMNLTWIVDGETYAQTTCEYGDDIVLPTTPTKYGYTFQGWDEFTFLEYIQSSGTQRINTQYIVAENDVLTIKARFLNSTSDNSDHMLIYSAGTTGLWFETYGNSFYARFGSTTSVNTTIGNRLNGIYEIKKGSIKYNGNSVLSPSYYSMPAGPLHIFCRSDNSGCSSARIEYFKITDGNTGNLVRDYVPARRNSDGAIGLYDNVTQTFLTNSRTGTFIAGPDL